MIETVDDIIDALGGTTVVAQARGFPPSTVSSWRKRKSIPGDWWADLADLARERGVDGITVETLAELHRKPAPLVAELRP